MIEFTVQSRLRTWPLPASAIRRAACVLSDCCLPSVTDGEISISLVSAQKMAHINELFLGHTGPTDVITFNYGTALDSFSTAPGGAKSVPSTSMALEIQAEILICAEIASKQCRAVGVGWRHEVLRYLVHGFLHLAGHDDQDPEHRKVMKRVENRLVRQTAKKLGAPWTLPG